MTANDAIRFCAQCGTHLTDEDGASSSICGWCTPAELYDAYVELVAVRKRLDYALAALDLCAADVGKLPECIGANCSCSSHEAAAALDRIKRMEAT